MLIKSVSWGAFKENLSDVDRLTEIHADISGDTPGRKYGVEVLNKSAIVLITACWEVFCEDLCREAFDFMLRHVKTPGGVPADVRWKLGRVLREDKDERRVWSLAGEGWKAELRSYGGKLLSDFHTPTSRKVDELFKSVLGLKRVSDSWSWAGMSIASARMKLDKLIKVRGSLAHRARAAQTVRKRTVVDYTSHVSRLVERTTLETAHYLRTTLGFGKTQTVDL